MKQTWLNQCSLNNSYGNGRCGNCIVFIAGKKWQSMLRLQTQAFKVREYVCIRGGIKVAGQFSSEHFLVFLPSLFISDMSVPRGCPGGYHSRCECPPPLGQLSSTPGRQGMVAWGQHPLPTTAGSPEGLVAGVLVSLPWEFVYRAFHGVWHLVQIQGSLHRDRKLCIPSISEISCWNTSFCLKA